MQVDQVGGEHVHADHALEYLGFMARGFGFPVGSVVHDGAQAVGVILETGDEVENAGLAGEVRRQGGGAALTQLGQSLALAAVADDHRLPAFQQAQCAVQADALSASGDEDGRGRGGHGGSRSS